MKTYLLKFKTSLLLCFILIFLFAELGYSQEVDVSKYPSQPITFIQPFTAGSPVDIAIRLITKEAEKFLGQPIVVLNKAGGAGSIGVAAIATAKPDGYTIGNTSHSPIFVVPLAEKVPYHPVDDLRFIMQFGGINMGVIVKADSPFKTFKDLIDYARQNPKKLVHGTTGVINMQLAILKQIAKKENVEFTYIPFKASADMQTALLGGHIHFGSGDFNYSMIEAGQISLLLLYSEVRLAEYPQTPIIKDLGYDFPAPMPILVAGPKGLPEGIVKKLEGAFTRALKEPAYINGMKELRLPIIYRNSKELGDYVARNYEVYKKVLKEMELIK